MTVTLVFFHLKRAWLRDEVVGVTFLLFVGVVCAYFHYTPTASTPNRSYRGRWCWCRGAAARREETAVVRRGNEAAAA